MATENRELASVDQAAIDRTVESLKSRNVDTVVAENGDEARQILIGMIPDGAEVFKSTSETLDTIGYSDYIREADRYRNLYTEISAEPDRDRQRELRRLASVAEYYIGSVHAIAETGEVIVASGSGSQLGAYVYGAKYVIWVSGVQKICPSLDEALARVKGFAVDRHHEWAESQGRPAAPLGKLTVFENEQNPDRIKMVLIKESLGW
ncbi:MAG: lactate utilization protein [Chloroflexota bacterium]|nr:lactate utilization protein [Chloroflexota bacterium]